MAAEQLDSFFTPEGLAQLKELKSLSKDLRDIAAAVGEVNSASRNIENTTVKGLKDVKDGTTKLLEEEKKRLSLQFQLTFAASEQAKELAVLQAQLNQQNKANKDYAQSVTQVRNAYQDLDKQHKLLKVQAQQLGAIFGTNSKQFIDASKAANEYGKKLKDIDSQLGDYRRNVGNYASGFSGISQVLRELPNAAISAQTFFTSISNNLVQVGDDIKRMREQNALLISQGQKSIPVFRQIVSNIISWQTALIALAFVLTKYGKDIGDWISGMNAADTAMRKLKTTSNEYYATQASKLESYRRELENASTSEERLHQIRNAIVKDYPATKEALEGEIGLRGRLTTMIDRLKEAVKQYAVVKATEKIIAEETEKMLRGELDLGGRLTQIWGAATGGVAGYGKASASAYNNNAKNYQSMLDRMVSAQTKAQEALRKTGGDVLLGIPDKATKTPKQKDFTNDGLRSEQELTAQLYREMQRRYEQQAEFQNIVIDNEQAGYNARIAALTIYNQNKFQAQASALSAEYDQIDQALKVIETIEAKSIDKRTNQEKTLLLKKEALLQQRRTVEAEYDLLYVKAQTDLFKKIDDIYDKEGRVLVDKALKRQNDIAFSTAKSAADELEILSMSYRKGELSKDQYEEKKKEIQLKYTKQRMDITVAELEAEANSLKDKGFDVSRIEEQITNLKRDQQRIRIEDAEQAAEKEIAAYRKFLNNISEAIAASDALSQELQGIVTDRFAAKLEQYDIEADKLERNNEIAIRGIKLQGLSKEEQEKKIRDQEAKTEAERKIIDARRRQEQARQARFQRLADIGTIIARTSIAVITALTEGDPYTKTFRAIAAGAIGAAQLIRAIAAPIPQYRFGTDNHPNDGPALVGEGGEPELIKQPGKPWEVVTKPTVKHLKRRTQVIPQHKLLNSGFGMITPQLVAHLNQQKNDKMELGDKTINKLAGRLSTKMIVNVNSKDTYIDKYTKR